MSQPKKTEFVLSILQNQYTDWGNVILMYFKNTSEFDCFVGTKNKYYAIKKFRKKFNIPKQVNLK